MNGTHGEQATTSLSALPCSLADRGREPLELCAFDGKYLHLISRDALAPGQPLALTVALPTPLALQLKSLGSVRRPDGRYDVRARATTLPRGTRDALLRFFAQP